MSSRDHDISTPQGEERSGAAGEWAGPLLRAKALASVEAAIARLPETAESDEAVHDVRRRLKELRALADLLRDRLPRRGRPDRAVFRELGRRLAPMRDAKAAVEAFDKLRDRYSSEWTPQRFLKIRRALLQRMPERLPADALEPSCEKLIRERRRIAGWHVDGMRTDNLWSAIRRSYRRSRRSMFDALEAGTPERFHEWRRRAKTHWYHAKFLSETGLARLGSRAQSLHELSRLLGSHHDLAVLDTLLAESPERFGAPIYVQEFRAFVADGMRRIESEAASLGRELFEDRPSKWEENERLRGPRRGAKPARPPSRASAKSA